MTQAAGRTPDRRRRLGQRGEAIAAQALVESGLEIVERNWRCRQGEIDIVARDVAPDYVRGVQDAAWLVLVEVRTRRGDRFGTARESVNWRKQAKLRTVAEAYVQQAAWTGPWRIDVVAVQVDGAGRVASIEHIRNAVTGA
jgi:putative endonuclease